MPSEYRSIFWEDDWAHLKHYGWSIFDDKPGLRIVKRRYGPVDRYLMLVTDEGRRLLGDVVAGICRPTFFGELIIHDFNMAEPASLRIGPCTFTPLGPEKRLLNIRTIVVDLANSEEVLLSQMNRYYPRDMRRAQSRGVVIDAHEDPDRNLQESFVNAYAEFAVSKSISSIDAQTLADMYRRGSAVLFTARVNETITHYLHVYKAGQSAQAMWGLNVTKETGSGILLHWEAMRYFKQRGMRWFDFGGLPTSDPTDGIYSFKRRFGGFDLSLGNELGYTAPALSIARNLMPTGSLLMIKALAMSLSDFGRSDV